MRVRSRQVGLLPFSEVKGSGQFTEGWFYSPEMKKVVAFLLVMMVGLAAEVKEVSPESGLRRVMFDLLRAEVAKKAGLSEGKVKFEGSLQSEGNWAFFGGRSLGADSKAVSFEPMGNDDTCALFLKTYRGWVLVDWSAGHSDVFYAQWVTRYGVAPEVLGLTGQ